MIVAERARSTVKNRDYSTGQPEYLFFSFIGRILSPFFIQRHIMTTIVEL
jgi:hypothetical protein